MVCYPRFTAWLFVLAAALLIAGVVGSVSAVGVTIYPQQVTPGQPVTITIKALPDNTTVSIGLRANISVTPGSEFTFLTNRFSLPFTLEGGQILATMEGTDYNTLEIQKGDTSVKKVGSSHGGVFSTSNAGTIPNGTYDFIKLSGTVLPNTSQILAAFSMEGVKKGPSDSEITFSVAGITAGAVEVTVTAAGSDLLREVLQVGSGASVPSITIPVPSTSTTTVVQTTAATATTMAAYQGGGGSSGGSSSGGGGGGSSTTSPGTGTLSTTQAQVVNNITEPPVVASQETMAPERVSQATVTGTLPEGTAQATAAAAASESTGSPVTTRAGLNSLLPVMAAAGAVLVLHRRLP